MNKPLTPVDLVGADFKSASEAYAAQRKTRVQSTLRKPAAIAEQEARQRLKEAVSEEERVELKDLLKAIGKDPKTLKADAEYDLELAAKRDADASRLHAFQRQVAASMMAGGMKVDDMAQLKQRAINNIAQDTNGSLHEAQLRVDALIGSGQSKDMAELVKWGNLGRDAEQLPQNDAARDMGLETPTPKPQHKRKVENDDELDRGHGR